VHYAVNLHRTSRDGNASKKDECDGRRSTFTISNPTCPRSLDIKNQMIIKKRIAQLLFIALVTAATFLKRMNGGKVIRIRHILIAIFLLFEVSTSAQILTTNHRLPITDHRLPAAALRTMDCSPLILAVHPDEFQGFRLKVWHLLQIRCYCRVQACNMCNSFRPRLRKSGLRKL
jgi:hypothetical protein